MCLQSAVHKCLPPKCTEGFAWLQKWTYGARAIFYCILCAVKGLAHFLWGHRLLHFRKMPEALKERYRVGSLLGTGGFGSVFSGTRLADGAPVAIKYVSRDRVRFWGELPDGTRAPLEIVLLAKVSTGCARPEQSQDLFKYIKARGFLPEEEARGLFRQVLEAVRHCTNCRVLHRDIKPGNIVIDLATGQAKLIDFGCSTFLQNTVYTQYAGTQSYSPPEWILDQCYYGEAATIWSLGIVLYQMVCGKHPFRKGRKIIFGELEFPERLSQGRSSSCGTGGIPVLGESSELISIPLWQLLRRWHMSCSPQNTDLTGYFRHSSEHIQQSRARAQERWTEWTGSFSS
uniref:non-specific serine/threonine protein kinase n=1 Tax=Malurus cyaneus samueli TaxID=2593467 RepID=A0A8C5UEY9_9PASS